MSNLLPIPGDTRPLTAQQQANQAAYLDWDRRSATTIAHLYTSGYRPDSPASGMQAGSVFAGGQAPSGFECL
jgi:hypothetical protein